MFLALIKIWNVFWTTNQHIRMISEESCDSVDQWFSTFFPPGRIMVQVQVSRAARMLFTYYVINTNQSDLWYCL